jgi:hypothetical protein
LIDHIFDFAPNQDSRIEAFRILTPTAQATWHSCLTTAIMTDDLLAQLKRNAAACAAAIEPPGNDPLYYMTGRAAAEIERLQAENAALRAALVEIGRMATEEGAAHFARQAAQALDPGERK